MCESGGVEFPRTDLDGENRDRLDEGQPLNDLLGPGLADESVHLGGTGLRMLVFDQGTRIVGRPDRIVRQGGSLIPEEWKSAKKVSHGHRLQLGAYLLPIEEAYGERPPFGVVVLSDGSRFEVENSEELRDDVVCDGR